MKAPDNLVTGGESPPADVEAAARLEAVARRLAELLVAENYQAAQDQDRLLAPKELALRLGLSVKWVYAHADELGAIRLGEDGRSRLWFRLGKVRERLDQLAAISRSAPSDNGNGGPPLS